MKIAFAGLLLCLAVSASAATITWTGASNTDWLNAANWSPAQVPTSADDVLIDTNSSVTISGAVPASFKSLTLGDPLGTASPTLQVSGSLSGAGALTVDPRATLLQDTTTQLSFSSVTVLPGGLLTHSPNTTARAAVLDLSVGGNFDLQAGASIAVSGRGYAGGPSGAAGSGPGGGPSLSACAGGGGHGGLGGAGSCAGVGGGDAYDGVTDPTDLGSGGAGSNCGNTGGAGGGAVILNVGGTMTIDGDIAADGAALPGQGCNGAGGGAGGTVNLTAATLTGSGTIEANGGTGADAFNSGGGGGGGHIAVIVTASDLSHLAMQTDSGATGGARAGNGGAGTIAVMEPGASSFSLIARSSSVIAQAATPVPAPLTFSTVTLDNADLAFTGGGVTVGTLYTADISTLTAPSVTAGSIEIGGTTTVTLGGATASPGPLEILGGGRLVLSANSVSGSLVVRSRGTFEQANSNSLGFSSVEVDPGGVLTHSPNAATRTAVLNLDVSGNFDLQAGASIAVSGRGYAGGPSGVAGSGPGGGPSLSACPGGGGHGGVGGVSSCGNAGGGATCDSPTNPTDLGSGGGGSNCGNTGGAGGGAVILNVGGTMTLDGIIAADGAFLPGQSCNGGGGGAGGTINLTAATLTGSGSIEANGGAAANAFNTGGGGGGGRIALFTGTQTSVINVTANGGTGNTDGASGSIIKNGQLSGFSSSGSTPTASLSQLQENLSDSQNLTETLSAQTLDFSGAVSTGVTPGTFSIADINLVTVQSGSFAGDGFFQGTWAISFPSGAFISGTWQGGAVLNPTTRLMTLKGSMEGGIRGVIEGTLSESIPGSGNFDTMALTCRTVQTGTQIGASTLFFSGSAPTPQTVQYPGTQLSLLQSSLTGQTTGYLVGPVENTFTLLTVNSSGNPYNGEGFFQPTYSAALGTGAGLAYAKLSPYSHIAQLSGVYDGVLDSLVEGILAASQPRSMLLTLERLDVGLPPQPELTTDVVGPDVLNSASTVTFSAALTNTGYAAAQVAVVAISPSWTDFVSASGDYTVYKTPYWVNDATYAARPFVLWNNVTVAPLSTVKFYYNAFVRPPTPGAPAPHTVLPWDVKVISTALADQVFKNLHAGLTP